MKRIYITFIFLTAFVSCKEDRHKTNVDNELIESCCDGSSPPSPPPLKNSIKKTINLAFSYKTGNVPIEISLVSDNLIKYLDKDIQTYRIETKSKFKNDTFYISVPIEENANWSNLTFSNANINNGILIGFENKNRFTELYRLTLGGEGNKGNVYLNNAKSISSKQNIEIIDEDLINFITNLKNVKNYQYNLEQNKRKLKIWRKGIFSIKGKDYIQICVGEENAITYSTRFNYLYNFETKEIFLLDTQTDKLKKIK